VFHWLFKKPDAKCPYCRDVLNCSLDYNHNMRCSICNVIITRDDMIESYRDRGNSIFDYIASLFFIVVLVIIIIIILIYG